MRLASQQITLWDNQPHGPAGLCWRLVFPRKYSKIGYPQDKDRKLTLWSSVSTYLAFLIKEIHVSSPFEAKDFVWYLFWYLFWYSSFLVSLPCAPPLECPRCQNTWRESSVCRSTCLDGLRDVSDQRSLPLSFHLLFKGMNKMSALCLNGKTVTCQGISLCISKPIKNHSHTKSK